MSFNNRPRPRRCGPCEGTGYVKEMGQETCPKCMGLKRDKNSDLWAEPCLGCNATGIVYYCRRSTTNKCGYCGGNGVIS